MRPKSQTPTNSTQITFKSELHLKFRDNTPQLKQTLATLQQRRLSRNSVNAQHKPQRSLRGNLLSIVHTQPRPRTPRSRPCAHSARRAPLTRVKAELRLLPYMKLRLLSCSQLLHTGNLFPCSCPRHVPLLLFHFFPPFVSCL
jgi:hypothetical protein